MHQITCGLHSDRPCAFLCTDLSNSMNIFKCDICIVEQRIKGTNVISIAQILQDNCSNSNATNIQLFNNLPFKGMIEIEQRLKELVKSQTWECKIQDYCKEFSHDIQLQIERISLAMQEKAKLQIDATRVEIINIYNNFSQKEQLKRIIEDESMELQIRSEKIKKILTEMLGQQYGDKKKIEEKMKELSERERFVDFKAAERVKDKIRQELQGISILLDENVINGMNQIVPQEKMEEVKISNKSKILSHFEENNNEEKQNITNWDSSFLSTYQNIQKMSYQEDMHLSEINQSYQQCIHQSVQGSNFFNSNTFDDYFQNKPETKDNNTPNQIPYNPRNNSVKTNWTQKGQWNWEIIGNQPEKIILENDLSVRIIPRKGTASCKILTQVKLRSDKLYQIKCTFSKPISECQGVSIGLHDFDSTEKIPFNTFDSSPGKGVNKIYSGQLLNKNPLNSQVKVIKFKICTGKQSFYVTDEMEQNINEGQMEKIYEQAKYCLGICLENVTEDFDIVISKPLCGNYKS